MAGDSRMPRAATRGAAGAALLLLLTACALRPIGEPGDGDVVEIEGLRYRIERVPRGPVPLAAVAPGWVNDPQRGLLAIHAETDDAYLVRIALPVTPPATVPDSTPSPTGHDTANTTAALQPEGRFVELETALPRHGEWRENFAIAAQAADIRLIAPPARKTLAPPKVWTRDPRGTWARQPQEFPRLAYDYGGVALGDFDADGHQDIALGMHLLGFAAAFGTPTTAWRDASNGLPHSRRDGEVSGSGVAVAALPDPAGDRLLLLPESDGRNTRLGRDLGLVEFRWRDGGWRGESISRGVLGTGLSLSALPGCAPLLAVKSSSNNQIPLFRHQDHRWNSLPSPGDHHGTWLISAIHLAQLDGARCADLLAARRESGPSGWRSALLLWIDHEDGWKSIPLPRLPPRFTLSAVWAERRDGHAHVVAGSAEGDLLYLRGGLGDLRWVGHLPPAAWRRGCGVAQIAALPGVDARWVVAFAGDGDRFDPRRCSSNGGLVEVRWETAAAH